MNSNWVANQLWAERLQWSGKEAFNAQIEVDGRVTGQWKSANGLTFLSIYEAGNMVRNSPVKACRLFSLNIGPSR